MTAPTQGKERGAAPPPAVPSLPPPHPSLAPFLAPLAPRAREPRALESTALSSLSSKLARCSRPTEKLAPHPAQTSLFRPGRTLLAWARGLGRCGTREPRASGRSGVGRRRMVRFQEPQPPSWAAPASGDPSQRGCPSACSRGPGLPREPRGHRRGWSAAPSRVPGAGRGRDPDRRVRELEFAPRARGPPGSRASGLLRGREGKDLGGREARGDPEGPSVSSAPKP